jgi:hypothetical protein
MWSDDKGTFLGAMTLGPAGDPRRDARRDRASSRFASRLASRRGRPGGDRAGRTSLRAAALAAAWQSRLVQGAIATPRPPSGQAVPLALSEVEGLGAPRNDKGERPSRASARFAFRKGHRASSRFGALRTLERTPEGPPRRGHTCPGVLRDAAGHRAGRTSLRAAALAAAWQSHLVRGAIATPRPPSGQAVPLALSEVEGLGAPRNDKGERPYRASARFASRLASRRAPRRGHTCPGVLRDAGEHRARGPSWFDGRVALCLTPPAPLSALRTRFSFGEPAERGVESSKGGGSVAPPTLRRTLPLPLGRRSGARNRLTPRGRGQGVGDGMRPLLGPRAVRRQGRSL